MGVARKENICQRQQRKDDQLIKDPLESDHNDLFQTKDLIIEKQASLFPSQA